MTENLRLDNEPELSQQNTNNPSLPLTNSYAEQITSNKLSISSSDWCVYYNGPACYDQSILNTDNTVSTTVSPAFSQDFASLVHKSFSANIYSYSNYYNWYLATAGNGKLGTATAVVGDICPGGWQLPVGDSNNTSGSFYYLNQQMGAASGATGSNNWRSFPNNFLYSSQWSGSKTLNSGSFGSYWPSTSRSGSFISYVYILTLNKGSLGPGTGLGVKGNGFSVRCVAPVQ